MLTDSILANGCEMPLVVWNGIIVDGHNRYRICRENGVPFAVEEKAFDSREAAEIWIIRNQLGRRNLSDFQRCELVLPLEERLKAEAEKRMLFGKGQPPDPVPNLAQGLSRTRDALAAMAGVSHGNLDKAKRIMEFADEDTKDRLRRGELSIHRAYSSLAEGNPKEEKDTEKPASEPVPVKKQEYTSLLKKPIFDHYEPPAYMKPIPFEPIAPTAPPDEPEEAEENTAAERVRELGRAFLDGLDKELKEAEREGLEQILAIVEDVGKKVVQTVKKYCNEHQEEKQP